MVITDFTDIDYTRFSSHSASTKDSFYQICVWQRFTLLQRCDDANEAPYAQLGTNRQRQEYVKHNMAVYLCQKRDINAAA